MSKKAPKIMPKMDGTGRAIASYHSACEGQREVNAKFMAQLADKSCGHFGSATPTMFGHGIDAAIVGTEP